MQIEVFDPINIIIPKKEIFKRLGYTKDKTIIAAKDMDKIDAKIDEAACLLRLKGAGLRFSIEERCDSKVSLSRGIVFESKLVARILKDCEETLLMGVTAGREIMEAIGDFAEDDLSSAVVYDAVASESTDACFGWIQNYYQKQLSRENKQLIDKRISCGYSDFKLEYQKTVYRVLELKKLGVILTESLILIPEKSATALTGISQIK